MLSINSQVKEIKMSGTPQEMSREMVHLTTVFLALVAKNGNQEMALEMAKVLKEHIEQLIENPDVFENLTLVDKQEETGEPVAAITADA